MKNIFIILVLIACAFAFAQSELSRNVAIGSNNYSAKIINGTAFLPATDTTHAFGVGITKTPDSVVLTQGGRFVGFDLVDSLYTAAARNDGISVNGETQNGPAASELDGQVWLPIKVTAEALGATVSDTGNDIAVQQNGAELQNVKKTLSETQDRISIELSRDIGFKTSTDGGELTIDFLGATIGEGDYQVGGKYIKKLPVTQNNGNLQAKLKLEDDVGYNIFALPAGDGLPARIVLDVGPGIGANQPALEKLPIRVVLDAGHGGDDFGAKNSGFIEKNLTLSVAKKIGKKLSERGIVVRYTRSDDTSTSLSKRQQLSVQSDVFVSIHFSAITGAISSGTTIYYLSPDVPRYGILRDGRAALQKDDKKDVSVLLQHYISNQKESLNLADDISTQMLANGEKQEPQVLTGLFEATLSQAPKAAVLIELAWLSNQTDRKLINDPEKFTALTNSIAAGIGQYVERLKK